MIKAILTGHSKGLGLGTAQALLKLGHPVLGLSRTQNTKLQAEFPEHLRQVQLDLSQIPAPGDWLSTGELEQFMENATLVLLINNAGLVSPIGPLNTQQPDEIARGIQLNVTAPMVLGATIASRLKTGQELRVLHISSGAGQSAYPGWSVYCASKAALDMHAKAVQMDGQSNIKICSLAPGVIDTDMQTQIRQTDVALFPNKQRFIELNETGSLAKPQWAGEQIVSYLLSSDFGRKAVDDLRGL